MLPGDLVKWQQRRLWCPSVLLHLLHLLDLHMALYTLPMDDHLLPQSDTCSLSGGILCKKKCMLYVCKQKCILHVHILKPNLSMLFILGLEKTRLIKKRHWALSLTELNIPTQLRPLQCLFWWRSQYGFLYQCTQLDPLCFSVHHGPWADWLDP